jgi:nitroreductase
MWNLFINVQHRYVKAIFMSANSLVEVLKSRRAIRSYEDKAVPDSAIQTMLESATYAPSAINVQPWKFTIVTNKTEMTRLSDIAKKALLPTLPDFADEGLERFKRALADPNYNIFYGAPLLIYISGIKSPYAVNDCSMAAQNMMLTAYTLGIGSCWIGAAVHAGNSPKVKADLGVPEDNQVYAAVIFGYPKEGFPKAPEKRPAQILKRID